MNKFKKFFLSFSLIFVFTAYAINQRLGHLSDTHVTPENEETGASSDNPNINHSFQTGIYKNGEYAGNIADAYYGEVQVKVTMRNDKMIAVQFLNYPHDRSKSININAQAMPYLKTEAIQAQSAEVDIVSGATLTSEAFRESLAFALNKAKN